LPIHPVTPPVVSDNLFALVVLQPGCGGLETLRPGEPLAPWLKELKMDFIALIVFIVVQILFIFVCQVRIPDKKVDKGKFHR
jgi:heme/copper-type cytochrome/quinol oxidase subunit 2